MARRVVGIDLGAYSVKLVRLEVGKQTPKFEVVTISEEILPLDEEGSEPQELADKQRDAILRLSQQGLIEAEAYAIGLDPPDGQMRSMKVPRLDNRKIDAVLPGLLETEVPFDVDDMIVSWHRTENEKAVIEGEPSDFVDIRIAFGKKPTIARLLHTLQPASIDPRLMHLCSAAPYEIVRELGYSAFDRSNEEASGDTPLPLLSAVIDFGHRATNLCIFDKNGIKLTRTFLKGGRDLNDALVQAFEVTPQAAVDIKHNKVDLHEGGIDDEGRRATAIAKSHFNDIFDDIVKAFIVTKASGIGEIKTVALIGGACKATNFHFFMQRKFEEMGIMVVPSANWLPTNSASPSTALALSYALSGLQVHAKDSRFNFRKDEFAWRGELDFVRTKSVPLILWGLTVVCAFTVLWSASSLVLEKENQYLEGRLKAACSQILGQKNVAPKKCLIMMKEQIASQIDFGIPEFTATDLYVKSAELLPKELALVISELDVMEKKVRINAETTTFADVDKVVTSLSTIPCIVKVERGRAQQVGNVVKFSLSSDFDCNAAKSKSTTPATTTTPDAVKENEAAPTEKSTPKA